ncbi:MAG: hypothetical protein IT318_04765 [Anaerolineales bacterium]|nr:hypothetical protein [Anaerolineales bacterium]
MFITTTYGYDAANRLISVGSQNYTWANTGNLLTDGVFACTYDAADRLLTTTTGVTATGFTYTDVFAESRARARSSSSRAELTADGTA